MSFYLSVKRLVQICVFYWLATFFCFSIEVLYNRPFGKLEIPCMLKTPTCETVVLVKLIQRAALCKKFGKEILFNIIVHEGL